jgi:hypothetical protein
VAAQVVASRAVLSSTELISYLFTSAREARDRVIGSGAMTQAGWSQVRFSMTSMTLPNISSRAMALGLTQS